MQAVKNGPWIYIASKAVHRQHWRVLRDQAGAPFNSRWIDIEDNVPDEEIDFIRLWEMCEEDVRDCRLLIAVVKPDERLKGVLVEIGMALAFGKDIIVIGNPGRENGTWINHPRIRWHPYDTIENALTHLAP